nr:uncharacterized protein LOC122272463 [Parasteatoda tepidariorum]
MTEAQREMLTKYAPECICIDSTHGTNAYDFQLTTLLVLDDMRQGLPCAFMISSKVNQDTCAVFFSEIKDVVGDISTAIFMSDMAETYYNAWLSTFHTVPTNRLYCAWHVDNAWRNNLNKIKNQDLRVFVYKILKTLMYETDVNTFEVLLTKTKDMFSLNDELKQFGDYFFQFYGQNSACWAYCYRTNLGINTNMHLESMHRTLKYIYFKGKKVKRLDKSVIQIMKFIRDKLFDRLVILHKGKLVPKLSDLRLRHQTSLALSLDFVSEINDSFIVLSSNDPATTYMVKKNNKSCTCRLRCDECDSCLHAYTCTCIDASIKNNMCKHIHLTCRYLQSKQCIDKVGVEATSLCIDTDKADKDFEENVIVTELLKESGTVNISLIEAKEDLIKKFSDMIYGIKDASEVKILNDTYKSAQVKLLAHHNSTTPLNPLSPTKKRKIAPQRRLFSVKNKRVKRNNAISNPTVQESQDIALSLIMPK